MTKKWHVSGEYTMLVEAETAEEAINYGCDKIGNGWNWEAKRADQMTDEMLDQATQASIKAEEEEVMLALTLMCIKARVEYGIDAAVIELADSDQGEWKVVEAVRDNDWNVVDETDFEVSELDDYASHLYDSRDYLLRRFCTPTPDALEIEIDKVLPPE